MMLRHSARVALSGVVLAGILAVTSSPVAAASLSGGSGTAQISCSDTLGLITPIVKISPQSGYSKQWVTFRLQVQDVSTGLSAMGAWQPYVLAPFVSAAIPVYAPLGHKYLFHLDYAWYNGNTWSTAGEWISNYTQTSGTVFRYTSSYCYA